MARATVKTQRTRIVKGQHSWRLASKNVEAFVTEVGGHLGPVTFSLRGRRIQPFSVAPWAEEKTDPSLPAIIKALRGDFFCLPFGGNATDHRGEKHPVHGETANARWRLESLTRDGDQTVLHLSLTTKIRRGQVDKILMLCDGQDVVYSKHIISNMGGPMNPGHHAMLKFPDSPHSGVLSTSPFVYGQVFPGVFESPANGGYSLLKPGAEFDSLESVPSLDGTTADLTRYPARRGFEDLVMVVSDTNVPFAWVAVVFPREQYVWFALKNPNVLRETVFWISNGGRHYPPWNGRHINVLGIEDVTACFHYGLAESAGRNAIAAKGFPTAISLNPRKPTVVPYIMGVAEIPRGFDRVSSIQPTADNQSILLRSTSGKQVRLRVGLEFLRAE
jgi:hypothetical protein